MSRKLLILESQVIIALDLAERVRRLGWVACGPYSSTQEALAGLNAANPDAALLDLSVHEDSHAEPVADVLRERGVPFIFMNSYAKQFDAVHAEAPRLEKPFSDGDFLAAVARFDARHATGPAKRVRDPEPPAPV